MPEFGPAAYKLITDQVRLKVISFVTAAFTGLGSWRDEDIEAFVARVTPVVTGGQIRLANLTHAYLAGQVSGLFGAGAPVGTFEPEEVSGSTVRNGTDPATVYRRPAVELYSALKQGLPLEAAVQRGANRIGSLVSTDLQLAKTHATRATFRGSPAQYYRRTLNGSKNCALCVVASTQRYKTNELMPCHPGCNCGVEPVKGKAKHVLDQSQLDAIHDQVARFAGQSAKDAREVDYRQILVTRNHGEYGPTLAYRGQAFTGPADIS